MNENVVEKYKELLKKCTDLETENKIISAAVENAKHIFYITDKDGRIEYVNPAFEKITGFSKEEALGEKSSILQSGFMKDSYYQDLWKTILDGGHWAEEIINTTKSGETYYAYQIITPIFDDDNNIIKFAAIQNDITKQKQNERKIMDLTEDYELIFNNVRDAIFLINVNKNNEFRYQRLNPVHEKLSGLTTDQVQGKTPVELLGEDTGSIITSNYKRCLDEKKSIQYEEILALPGGKRIWSTKLSPVFSGDRIVQIIGVSRDITAQKDAERQKDIFFEVSADLICIIDKEGRFHQLNPAWDSILASPSDFKKFNIFDFIYSEDLDNAKYIFESLVQGEILKSLDLRLIKKDQSVDWYSWNAIFDTETELIYAIGRNINERKMMEKNLIRLSTTDNLTGAYNRHKMVEELESEVSRSARYDHDLSLIMLDIDHFKQVNDNFGHEVGDKALKNVSEIIECIKRETDIFSRWGGEEFLLLLPDTDLEGGIIIAERIRAAVEKYEFESAGKITVSMGVSTFKKDKHNTTLFIRDADDALYEAKNNGRNRVEYKK